MVTLLSLCRFAITGFVIPYIIGFRIIHKVQKEQYTPMQSILAGYLIVWAFFEIILVPMIFAKASFNSFFLTAGIIILVACVCEVVLQRKEILAEIMGIGARIKANGVLRNVLFLVILVEACYVGLAYLHDDDDAFYVATAQTTLDTNTMMQVNPYTGGGIELLARYVLSPFPMFIAFMSKACGVKAAVMAHTFLPVILILLVYVVYFMWAQELFPEDKEKQTYFLLYTVIILAFSMYSVYARGTFMFTRIWQGKAVLATLLLPFVLLFGIRLIKRDLSKAEFAFLFAMELACCHVSSVGIMLGAIELGVCIILAFIHSKKLKRVVPAALACLPNVIYAVIYIIIR